MESMGMIPFADWFPLFMIGAVFTIFGLMKVHGFRRKIVGGGGKPFTCRLRGACPTWSTQISVSVMVLFLVIGLSSLSILSWLLLSAMLR
jgi:hypothetical protein